MVCKWQSRNVFKAVFVSLLPLSHLPTTCWLAEYDFRHMRQFGLMSFADTQAWIQTLQQAKVTFAISNIALCSKWLRLTTNDHSELAAIERATYASLAQLFCWSYCWSVNTVFQQSPPTLVDSLDYMPAVWQGSSTGSPGCRIGIETGIWEPQTWVVCLMGLTGCGERETEEERLHKSPN